MAFGIVLKTNNGSPFESPDRKIKRKRFISLIFR